MRLLKPVARRQYIWWSQIEGQGQSRGHFICKWCRAAAAGREINWFKKKKYKCHQSGEGAPDKPPAHARTSAARVAYMLLLCGWSQTRHTQLLIAHFWRAAAFIETMRNGCVYAILLYLTARLTLCLWIGRTSERAPLALCVCHICACAHYVGWANKPRLSVGELERSTKCCWQLAHHLSTSQWQLWHAWLFSAVYFQNTEPRIYWKRMVVKMWEVKSLPAAWKRNRKLGMRHERDEVFFLLTLTQRCASSVAILETNICFIFRMWNLKVSFFVIRIVWLKSIPLNLWLFSYLRFKFS